MGGPVGPSDREEMGQPGWVAQEGEVARLADDVHPITVRRRRDRPVWPPPWRRGRVRSFCTAQSREPPGSKPIDAGTSRFSGSSTPGSVKGCRRPGASASDQCPAIGFVARPHEDDEPIAWTEVGRPVPGGGAGILRPGGSDNANAGSPGVGERRSKSVSSQSLRGRQPAA